MNTIFYKQNLSQTAIINPTDHIKPLPNFPEVCISTFSKAIIDKFAALEHVEIIAHITNANGTIPIYKITYGGKEIAFYLSLVCAPASVCCLEEVIALGAKKFVFFGCCGVLDDDYVQNHIIVPTSAVRDEGTSYHYISASEEIEQDAEMTDILKICLDQCGYTYVSGKIWTTDAIYRETLDLIKERKIAGCIGVEMEYSALLAVAKYRKVKFVQFFYGADNLDGPDWDPRDLSDYGLSNADKYFALAMECALNI